jgi:hypothetical protein
MRYTDGGTRTRTTLSGQRILSPWVVGSIPAGGSIVSRLGIDTYKDNRYGAPFWRKQFFSSSAL